MSSSTVAGIGVVGKYRVLPTTEQSVGKSCKQHPDDPTESNAKLKRNSLSGFRSAALQSMFGNYNRGRNQSTNVVAGKTSSTSEGYSQLLTAEGGVPSPSIGFELNDKTMTQLDSETGSRRCADRLDRTETIPVDFASDMMLSVPLNAASRGSGLSYTPYRRQTVVESASLNSIRRHNEWVYIFVTFDLVLLILAEIAGLKCRKGA